MITFRRGILIALVLNFVFNSLLNKQAFASLKETTHHLSTRELSLLLLGEVSPINNSQRFFLDISKSPLTVQKVYEKAISDDEALRAMAYKGQQFHQYYLIKLQEGFGGDLLPWATDPDAAIYKELIRFNRRVVPQNSEIPEHAAARRAWQETLSRLQLSPSLSFTEIAESTKTNPIHGQALDLYRRLYLYFLEETISVDKIPPFKMNEFVDHIEKKIIRARVANFYQSVQLLKLTRKKPLYFVNTNNRSKNPIVLSVDEFSKFKIKFIKDLAHRGTHRLHIEREENWLTELFRNFSTSLKKKDVEKAQAYYEEPLYFPSTPTNLVVLEFGKTTIRLSERNFSELLNQIVNVTKKGSVEQAWLGRYLLESSRRDVMLANALSFLKRQRRESRPSVIAELYSARIEANRIKLNNQPTSLTERMRNFNDRNESVETTHQLTHIRWAGYQIHPDYWLVRDAVSKMAKGIEYEKILRNETESPVVNLEEMQATRNFTKALGTEKSNRNYREGSFLKRSSIVARPYALAAMLMTVVTGGTFLLPSLLDLSSSTKKDIETLRMTDTFYHENNPDDFGQFSERQVIFEATPLRAGIQLPKYYNILGVHNLPWDLQHFRNYPGEEPNTVHKMNLIPFSQKDGDIRIENKIPFTPFRGRIPILTPDYYQIKSIQVTRGNLVLKYQIDYKVYQVPSNGLYYFELSDNSSSKEFIYKVTFSEGTAKPLPPSIASINSNTLREVTEELRKSGAIQLSDHLISAITSKPQLTLKEIENVFSNSGEYTFHPDAELRGNVKNPFFAATKYLINNDGIYYYQCTGSNFVLQTFLKGAHRNSHLHDQVKIEQVNGFVLQNEEGKLAFPGHRRTLISGYDGTDRFLILDATPIKMDPKYENRRQDHPLNWKQKKKRLPRKRPKPDKQMLPGRREIKIEDEPRVEKNKEGDENKPKESHEMNTTQEIASLLKLKNELRNAILTILRESHHPISTNSVPRSLQDLFFLVDALSSYFSGNGSQTELSDKLIAYRTGLLHSGITGPIQDQQIAEFRDGFLLNFGSEEGVILYFIDSIRMKFSSLIELLANHQNMNSMNTHHCRIST